MSFAQRFAAGQQIAKGLIDTYQTGKRNKELGAVADWKKSDEYEGYTPQDAEQMHAIANAKDANGNPYYQMQDDGKGGLRVQSNFSYAGADGAEVAPGAQVGLAPRKVVDYGGQRYANEELTPERMTALQDRERANIIGRYDPEAGLKMRRQLSQDERETKRFGWEEQGQPLKQRAAELQVESGERGERAGQRTEEVQKIVDQVAAMPEDALKVYAAKLNTNESTLPFLMVGESKSGYKFLTIDPKTGTPTGNEFTLNSSQLRQMAAASVLGMMGKGQESMALLSEVNKDVAKAVADMNGVTASVVGSQNFALKAERGDEQDEARTNIAAQGLALRRAAAGSGRGETPEDTGPKWVNTEEGKTQTDERTGRTRIFTDGEWIDRGGVSTAGFADWMEANGLPPQADEMLERHPAGRHVRVPDAGDGWFDLSRPQEVQALKAAVARATNVREKNATAGNYRPETTEVAPRNNTILEQRRAALMSQEQARRQALAQQEAAAREAERTRLLSGRPDLTQLGLRPLTQ